MRLYVRRVAAHPDHTTVRIFVDDTSAGLLTMTVKQERELHEIMMRGAAILGHSFDHSLPGVSPLAVLDELNEELKGLSDGREIGTGDEGDGFDRPGATRPRDMFSPRGEKDNL